MLLNAKKITGLMAVLFIGMAITFSCKHETLLDNSIVEGGTQPCSADTVYFQNQVLPLLVSNCAMGGCHDAGSAKEGVILTNYTTIRNTGKISVGNGSGSKLYKVLIAGSGDRMPVPPRQAFTAAQAALIKKWIDQGAKNNNCADCDTSGVMKYSTNVQPLLQSSCVGCHNSSSLGGGIDLTTYANVKTQVTNGKLMGSINWSTGYSAMPKGGQKLSSCKINQIQKWITAGALNN